MLKYVYFAAKIRLKVVGYHLFCYICGKYST